MRLLLVHHSAGPYGAERVLNALAKGLWDRGHDLIVELPHEGPAAEAARTLGLPDIRVADRHRLPPGPREALGFFATAPTAVSSARRTIRDTAPELVWINSLYNPWAAIAARLAGRPVVWHLHEYPLPDPLGMATAVLIAAAATRVVAISRFVADGWSRYPWLRGRIDVMPNPLLSDIRPVNLRGASPDGPPAPFTVGYIGQLEPRKRVTDVIRAVARLTDVRAVIVGDGKDRPATEAVIRDGRAGDRVELAGYVPDINAELARFHCLAIPSLREPFGLVALEAMAASVPVVAARSGALPEVLGDAALYHDPGDPDDLADQIRKLQADAVLRRELAARGRRRVETFETGPWLDRAEAVAQSALGRKGGRG